MLFSDPHMTAQLLLTGIIFPDRQLVTWQAHISPLGWATLRPSGRDHRNASCTEGLAVQGLQRGREGCCGKPLSAR
jgi:hypothetical protein